MHPNPRFHRRRRGLLAASATCVLALAPCPASSAEVATLWPDRDNTLINDSDGALSFALSETIFCGRIGSMGTPEKVRRGLLRFDLAAALPAGSTVVSVTLDVHCVMTPSGNQTLTLRRLLEDWGEGTSYSSGGAGALATPGDATWLHRFWPDDFWTTAGGVFAPAISASKVIGSTGPYSWPSTAGMVADVQAWLDQPEANFGWIVRGNESVSQSVKALGSRENQVLSFRPLLTVVYEPPPSPDLNGDGMVDGADVGLLLAAWGACPPPCPADLNGDGTVDAADLGTLLAAWSV